MLVWHEVGVWNCKGIGDGALKALIFAGMISRHACGRLALYTYGPTVKGKKQLQKREEEK